MKRTTARVSVSVRRTGKSLSVKTTKSTYKSVKTSTRRIKIR